MAHWGVRPSVVVEGILLCRSATAHKKTHQMLEDMKNEKAAQDAKHKTDEQLRSDKKQLYMKSHTFFLSVDTGVESRALGEDPTLDNVPIAAFVISVGISSTS